MDGRDEDGNTALHHAVKNKEEKVARLLVEHAASMTRNKAGLSPRDLALERPTHDLLKVEELRQSFRLRFDVVLVMSLEDGGMALSMGPPKPARVSHEALSQKDREARLGSTERVQSALLIIQRHADKYYARLRANRPRLAQSISTSSSRAASG